MLVKSSFMLFINYNKLDQQLYFSSKDNTFKNKSDISFQCLIYFTIHTYNINDNRDFKVTLLSIFEFYGILFNVKEI